ncbi:MAG: cbb3-type cytochrome c oxidase subunit 3 [Beijerinckiaceae bacterium]|jgi:cytochrome c oxidase cbb3-type subunit 4|nr:cbb3-type cytochrome c oxidase subunit 3 [Beijerinckiaceae bacterium]
MANMYAFLANIAQSVGVLYFMAIFLAVCIYALWPKNQSKFETAARLPLEED